MQDAILEKLAKDQLRKHPRFNVGDRINVFVRLKEGDKERVQAFRGICISKHPKSGNGINATFTVRKISEGVGVERIFPVHSPFIEKIDVETSARVRQSRLYYLRALKGRKARLKTSERFGDVMAATTEVAAKEEAAVATPAAAPVSAPAAASAKAETPKKK